MAHVLLIDDDQTLLEVLALSLQDAGHTVEVASDGLAGLELAEHIKPDVLIADVNMPKFDGFSLCRRLSRTSSPTNPATSCHSKTIVKNTTTRIVYNSTPRS